MMWRINHFSAVIRRQCEIFGVILPAALLHLYFLYNIWFYYWSASADHITLHQILHSTFTTLNKLQESRLTGIVLKTHIHSLSFIYLSFTECYLHLGSSVGKEIARQSGMRFLVWSSLTISE